MFVPSHEFFKRISAQFRSLFTTSGKKDFLCLLLKHTIERWTALWKACNEVIHGTNETRKSEEHRNRLHAELHYIYSCRELYLHKDKDILLPTLEEHQALPDTTIKNWLIQYKTLFSHSVTEAKRLLLQGVATITNYFAFT